MPSRNPHARAAFGHRGLLMFRRVVFSQSRVATWLRGQGSSRGRFVSNDAPRGARDLHDLVSIDRLGRGTHTTAS